MGSGLQERCLSAGLDACEPKEVLVWSMKGAVSREGEAPNGGPEGKKKFSSILKAPGAPERGVDGKGLKC